MLPLVVAVLVMLVAVLVVVVVPVVQAVVVVPPLLVCCWSAAAGLVLVCWSAAGLLLVCFCRSAAGLLLDCCWYLPRGPYERTHACARPHRAHHKHATPSNSVRCLAVATFNTKKTQSMSCSCERHSTRGNHKACHACADAQVGGRERWVARAGVGVL
jgi:hypothetical protein